MNIPNAMPETEVLRVELDVLKREHRELDEVIRALEAAGGLHDMVAIRRKKKEKLLLKDRIRVLEDRLLPDIIA
jgi:hypothetical protein